MFIFLIITYVVPDFYFLKACESSTAYEHAATSPLAFSVWGGNFELTVHCSINVGTSPVLCLLYLVVRAAVLNLYTVYHQYMMSGTGS